VPRNKAGIGEVGSAATIGKSLNKDGSKIEICDVSKIGERTAGVRRSLLASRVCVVVLVVAAVR
jgi:hypothetical protein